MGLYWSSLADMGLCWLLLAFVDETGICISMEICNLPVYSDCQGFQTPPGFWVGYTGIGVQVGLY